MQSVSKSAQCVIINDYIKAQPKWQFVCKYCLKGLQTESELAFKTIENSKEEEQMRSQQCYPCLAGKKKTPCISGNVTLTNSLILDELPLSSLPSFCLLLQFLLYWEHAFIHLLTSSSPWHVTGTHIFVVWTINEPIDHWWQNFLTFSV